MSLSGSALMRTHSARTGRSLAVHGAFMASVIALLASPIAACISAAIWSPNWRCSSGSIHSGYSLRTNSGWTGRAISLPDAFR
ncbi:hypothetical protein D3C83_86100 [compost metagenome]